MKIVIAGIGKVGYTLAANLAEEGHDVTCIDTGEGPTSRVNEELDVLGIQGNCVNLSVLESAGTGDADVFVAVSRQDEVNMLACLFAKRLGARHTVARIRDPEYAEGFDRFSKELDIDLIINPEHDTAAQITRLLRFPNALDIDTFHGGQVELVGFRVLQNDFPVGLSLMEIQKRMGSLRVLFCAIERNGQTLIPNGTTIIEAGDKVYIGGKMLSINAFFKALGRYTPKIKSVMVVGGSKTAVYLTQLLQRLNMSVKVFEQNRSRCVELCTLLPKAMILHGDGTEHEVLSTENLDRTDAFVALTGDDEANLIVSLYAKQMGVSKVVAKINRQNYYNVIAMLNIDSFINPKQVTVTTVLKYIRSLQASHSNSMLALYRIADGSAEAVEFSVDADTKHLNQPLKDIGRHLKKGVLVLSIQRDGEIIIPEGNTCLRVGDDITVVANAMRIKNLNDIFVN